MSEEVHSNSLDKLCKYCFDNDDGIWPCKNCGYDPSQPDDHFLLPIGTRLNNQYVVGGELRRNDFAITYFAYDSVLNCRVIIREYCPAGIVRRVGTKLQPYGKENDNDFQVGIDFFYKEAEILAKNRARPHITTVLEFFKENNTAYYVMEYLEGTYFSNYLKKAGGRISVEDANRILQPIMKELDILPESYFRHYQITPDSIFLTKDGESRLIDFSYARHEFIRTKRKREPQVTGYTAPEMFQLDSKLGVWTDIYGLAAVYYRAIMGYAPLSSDQRLGKDTLIKPRDEKIDISLPCENALLKALALDPEERWSSVSDFRYALTSIHLPQNDSEPFFSEVQQKDSRIERMSKVIVFLIALNIVLSAIISIVIYNF